MHIKHDYKWLEEHGNRLKREVCDRLFGRWDEFVKFMLDNFDKPGEHVFPLETNRRKKYLTHLTFQTREVHREEGDAMSQVSSGYRLEIGMYFTDEWEMADMPYCIINTHVDKKDDVADEGFVNHWQVYLSKKIDEYFFPKNVWRD